MKIRIGIYFNSRGLGTWDWREVEQRQTPLSGTDGQLLSLARKLSSRGHTVHFFSQDEGLSSAWQLDIRVNGLCESIERSKQLQLDVLLFMNLRNTETKEGVKLCERLGQAAIVWDQNGPEAEFGRLVSRAHCIRRLVCVSYAQAESARDKYTFSKISVIYNGLSDGSFQFQRDWHLTDKAQFLYVGSLTRAKGFHHVARIWPAVKSQFPHARLLVAGTGKLYNRHAELGPLGVADAAYEAEFCQYIGSTRSQVEQIGVRFLGLLTPRQVSEIASTSLAGIVNPSVKGSTETFCVSAAEIQAVGVPVIGGNAHGLREVVRDGETGLLVRNQQELQNALLEMLCNTETARQMGFRAREWVASKFHVDANVLEWETLIRDVVYRHPLNPLPLRLKGGAVRSLAREGARLLQQLPLIGGYVPPVTSVARLLRNIGGRSAA